MAENGKPYAWPARVWYPIYHLVARVSANHPTLQTKVARFGEIADWIRYLSRCFPGSSLELFSDKDKLRASLVSQRAIQTSSMVVVELGVADGSGSIWWLNALGPNLSKLIGCDRFTGLPRDWRGLKAGHFSTGGRVPEIRDSRIDFVVGDVEDTLPDLISQPSFRELIQTHQVVYVFDMDILEPTQLAFELLAIGFKSSDFVIFDEAFDATNERVVLTQLLHLWNTKLIGATSEAVAVQLLSPKLTREN